MLLNLQAAVVEKPEPPLVAVVADEMSVLDTHLTAQLTIVEVSLRQANCRTVTAVAFDGAKLAWAGAKGHWRLVLRDRNGTKPLLACARSDRAAAVASGALCELVKKCLS